MTRASEAFDLYASYCRPKLAELLRSLQLDVAYEKASGSYVFHREEQDGELTQVLDLVSGFGAGLLGHNNRELKRVLVERLTEDIPMLTQSAIRPGAAELARKLNGLVPAKGKYLCNLTNSGAEAVEAALKHAYKVRFDKIRREYERITREISDLCDRIEQEDLEVLLPDPSKDLAKFRDDLDEQNLMQFESFRQAPVVVALKGSFHGKTSSAVKVTFNKSYREGFEGLSAIHTVFIDPAEVERLPEIVAEQRVEFLFPRIEDGKVVLHSAAMTSAIALIFEVILGEGGIRALEDATLTTLARLHPELDLPYIIDEIQTGCGRTGAMFAYGETPLRDIEPDYITLSKALGGGLVKIGATLIHERDYDQDFGILHTSTFAEDDLSCAVACATLDILTRNGGELMQDVATKGAYLKGRLQQLRERYPDVVREVRGRGLMLGIEFQQLQERSPLFRYAGKQGFLSLLVTSYLLHHHRIRILAPLTTLLKGNPGKERQSVLRIQPSAYITRYEMDRFVAALDEVLNVIDCNNEALLIAHLIGEDPGADERRAPKRMPVQNAFPARREDFDARVGFVLHPTSLTKLAEFYFPSLRHYSWRSGRLSRWWNRLSRFLEPDVLHVAYIESDGFVLEANLVAVPLLPGTLAKAYAKGKRDPDPSREARLTLREIQDKVQDAVTVARELGDDHVPTSMVGLGAFTSIVTDQGATLNDYEVPVTTGNAHTAGLMIQAIAEASEIQGRKLQESVVAVVGAAGNIGSVLASLLCQRSGHVKLVGRRGPGANTRLKESRAGCMLHLLERARQQIADGTPLDEVELSGLARDIWREVLVPRLEEASSDADAESLQHALHGRTPLDADHGIALDRMVTARFGAGRNPYISLHDDLECLADCDVIAVATNSTDGGLITPDLVRRGAIVCCASMPSNLCATFREHMDDYFVFDGGLARLPEGNEIRCTGLPTGGLSYGCLSETLLMGFEGKSRTFAKGVLRADQVQEALELAELHGFTLGEFHLGQKVHPKSAQERRTEK
ncbi:MAG: aminotransferase class III-fold pyridoxal phosphate-dependent enzyme [Planctomycetota bacterium]|nr:aminotransferase class III-fold pyridoxal phosphate-dependent enzyme [Planctomycetota bacterium]